MTSLISAHSLTKAFGTQVLFDGISFALTSDDKLGLIGPNGAGKTSLIKILAGLEDPDSGYISKKQGLTIGFSSQSPVFPSQTIESFMVEQVPELESFAAHTRAQILLGKAEFTDFTQDASLLSGGWKKRLDIARALMKEPDFLLLDEPTNHLDLEGILWLENFLKRINTPFLVISHDRYFLENVTNKIMELNKCYPDGLLICQGNMSTYLRLKEDYLANLEKRERELSFKVREETHWLRQSPKARTTKSRSRIEQAYDLMDELSQVKQSKKIETVGIDFSASDRLTRKLIVAKNVSKALGGKELFNHVDLTLTPGMRLGIVGKNGTGKTTLLKILSGALEPDMGTIKFAENLKIVHFDQHREQVPPEMTLKEALCPYREMVNYRGREIHVNGWAKRFLFSPDRLNLPVGVLSGGERARILIAKLMLEPADVLFLDEPTNDLDIATLEVIEESLMTFAGTVVLISHDRCLMDRVCTNIIGLTEGEEPQYLASYDQWEKYLSLGSSKVKKEDRDENVKSSKSTKSTTKTKLSYVEKKELETIEEKILKIETELESLTHSVAAEKRGLDYYKRLGELQESLETHYQRWQDLLDRN